MEMPIERQIEDIGEQKDNQLTKVPRKWLVIHGSFKEKMVT